ncbi:MAG: bifunctional folylpolyglutamate synthase/dihydrofolate synthase [Planctomycetes bacterium]|nr:bifunctional folylpolyglutamate synthase/dihydrofolate synthase [Planctomycetota bacterium]
MPSRTTKRQSTSSTSRARSVGPARRTTKKKATGVKTASVKAKSAAADAPSSAAGSAITNYSTALRWLYDHTDYERMRLVRYNTTTFNLNRMHRLLKALGNPHKSLKFVHIAGTKGKGSTVAMLANMLQASGYTIGTYTSPHLIDLRERIAINGQMISHNDLTELFKLVKSKARQFANDPPTFFEIMTAVGIRHFADQAVDLAILETGLGGRLDSTNVVTPLICGITQISIDHTNILGKTLTEIASEKAGIIKKNIPIVTCEQTPAAMKVFKTAAEEVGAPLIVTGKDIEFSYRFESNRELGPHTRVCLTTPTATYDHLPVPLKGEHQALNCSIAIAILDKLREKGFKTTDEKITAGLAATRLPGRMEQVWEEPRILLDGAHNAASIAALIKSIGAHVPYDSLVMIFGCGEDKDIRGMLEQINLGADKVIFTRAKSNPRAVEPRELMQRFNEVSGKMSQTAKTLEDAFNLAARAVGREDLICVTGSFYLVGEAKKYLAELAAKRGKTPTGA